MRGLGQCNERWWLIADANDRPPAGFGQLMASIALVFLEPAVQNIGIHSMLPRQCRDGGPRMLARGHQFGFELRRIGPVGASA